LAARDKLDHCNHQIGTYLPFLLRHFKFYLFLKFVPNHRKKTHGNALGLSHNYIRPLFFSTFEYDLKASTLCSIESVFSTHQYTSFRNHRPSTTTLSQSTPLYCAPLLVEHVWAPDLSVAGPTVARGNHFSTGGQGQKSSFIM